MAEDIADLPERGSPVQQRHGEGVPQGMGPRLAVGRDETRPTVRFAKPATDGPGRCERCIRRAYADEQVARVPLAPRCTAK